MKKGLKLVSFKRFVLLLAAIFQFIVHQVPLTTGQNPFFTKQFNLKYFNDDKLTNNIPSVAYFAVCQNLDDDVCSELGTK